MANLDKDTVIAAFSDAYKKAHGKAPNIEAKSGWYSVDGGKNVRLAQLQEMVDSMSSQTTTKKEAKASSTPSKKKSIWSSKVRFFCERFLGRKA